MTCIVALKISVFTLRFCSCLFCKQKNNFISATNEFLVQTEEVENKLRAIFDKLYEERNQLREEVASLRSIIAHPPTAVKNATAKEILLENLKMKNRELSEKSLLDSIAPSIEGFLIHHWTFCTFTVNCTLALFILIHLKKKLGEFVIEKVGNIQPVSKKLHYNL